MVDEIKGLGGIPLQGDSTPLQTLEQVLNRAGINIVPGLIAQLKAIKVLDEANVKRVLSGYGFAVENVTPITTFLSTEFSRKPLLPIADKAEPELPHEQVLPSLVCPLHVHREYLLDPKAAQNYPNDGLSKELKRVLVNLLFKESPERRSQVFIATNWLLRDLVPAVTKLTLDKEGENLRFEYAARGINETLNKLEPKPDFDFSRFASPDEVVKDHHLSALGYALNEEITMPNGVFFSRMPSTEIVTIGVIIDGSEKAISPSGREVRVLDIQAVSESFGGAFASADFIIEPSDYKESCIEANESLRQQHQLYLKGRIPRERFDFVRFPSHFPVWLGMNFYSHCVDVNTARRDDDRLEVLALADASKVLEARLGRRYNQSIPEDTIAKVQLLLKTDSPLLKKLNSIEDLDEKRIFAYAVDAVRAKLIAMELSSYPALQFVDSVGSSLLQLDTSLIEAEHLPVCRDILAGLLGNELDSSLIIPEGKKVDPRPWMLWLRQNTIGHDVNSDIEAMRTFNGKIKTASSKILSEHFIRNLDEVAPGWQTYSAQWKPII